jgi:TolB-like protein
MTKLLGELKRRRVLNTASLYIVGAWLVLQVMDVLEGFFHPGALRWVLIGFALLYPVVLTVGWFFDVSGEGIRRTRPLPPGETLPRPEFIDHAQLGGQLLVIGFVGYLLSAPPVPVDDPQHAMPREAAPKAIAVLAFEDLAPASDEERVGTAFAEELREELTRTAGLKVMGPKTSELLLNAGDSRAGIAAEMDVTAILNGTVRVAGTEMTVDARVIAVPDGQPIWQASFAGPLGDAVRLKQELLRSVLGAVAPSLDPEPVNGHRTSAGQCSTVYEQFLRGKDLLLTSGGSEEALARRQRGRELIREATERDPDCAVAWDALALIDWEYNLAGFAKAGAAARRALVLNDKLPWSWSVLGEIAEQERRWSDAEEYFLNGLYADSTNTRVNRLYAETLIARGRARDSLRHILEAYARDPASKGINWQAIYSAIFAGEWDLALKHNRIMEEIGSYGLRWIWWERAYSLIKSGEREAGMALFDEYLAQSNQEWTGWYSKCVRAWADDGPRAGLQEAMSATWAQVKGRPMEVFVFPMDVWSALLTCDMWIGDGDIAIDVMLSQDITELQFIMFFWPDATRMRQHPRFRALVRESGLLDYWREWGWADMCEPVGEDDFRCQ